MGSFCKMIDKPALVLFPLLVLIVGAIGQRPVSDGDVTLTMSGIVPPVFTTNDEEGNLNLNIIPRYARFLKEKGIDGVLVSGTNGEGPTISLKDKKRLLEAWLRAARAVGLKVMSQVGGIPAPDAKEMATFSEKLGVDAILVLPELYFKPDTVKKLVYFMECIASVAPNTPILYYDVPKYTNVNVDMVQFFEEATIKISNFKGIKCDFDVALKVRAKLRRDQRIFVAGGQFVLPATLMGFNDFIMSEFNIFPDLMNTIIREGRSCELRQSRASNDRLQDYLNTIVGQGRPELPAVKEAMTLVTGIDVGPIREPQIPLTERQKQELEASLRRKGIKLRGSADA